MTVNEVKRAVIMDSCWFLLQRYHPESITVKQLLSNLGIAKSVFYRHFASRDHLFLVMWQQSILPLEQAILSNEIPKIDAQITLMKRNLERSLKLKRIEGVLFASKGEVRDEWLEQSRQFYLRLNQLPAQCKKSWLLLEGTVQVLLHRSSLGIAEHKSDWLSAAIS